MSDTVTLYDLDKRDYPSQRGDSFRSTQIFECWVCGVLTNRIVMGGHPGYGVRVVCPNSSECWHHELGKKMEWSHQPHPSSYKKELQKEIQVIKDKYEGCLNNDLKGDLKLAQEKRPVTNTFSRKSGSSCIHGF